MVTNCRVTARASSSDAVATGAVTAGALTLAGAGFEFAGAADGRSGGDAGEAGEAGEADMLSFVARGAALSATLLCGAGAVFGVLPLATAPLCGAIAFAACEIGAADFDEDASTFAACCATSGDAPARVARGRDNVHAIPAATTTTAAAAMATKRGRLDTVAVDEVVVVDVVDGVDVDSGAADATGAPTGTATGAITVTSVAGFRAGTRGAAIVRDRLARTLVVCFLSFMNCRKTASAPRRSAWRSEGSLANARITYATTSAGKSGRSALKSGGGSFACAWSVSRIVPPNGRLPASSSNAMTPKEY